MLKYWREIIILVLLILSGVLYNLRSTLSKELQTSKAEYQVAQTAIRSLNVELERQITRTENQVRIITRTITRPDGTVEKSDERVENKTNEFSRTAEKETSNESETTIAQERSESRVEREFRPRQFGSFSLLTDGTTLDSRFHADLGLKLGPLPLEGVIGYGYDQGDSDFMFGLRFNF